MDLHCWLTKLHLKLNFSDTKAGADGYNPAICLYLLLIISKILPLLTFALCLFFFFFGGGVIRFALCLNKSQKCCRIHCSTHYVQMRRQKHRAGKRQGVERSLPPT